MSEAAPSLPTRARRNTELGLLIVAIGLAVFAYVLVGLGLRGKVPGNVYAYGALLVVGYVVAHLVVRRFAPAADPVFLPTAVLAGFGYAVIFRLQRDLADAQALWLPVRPGPVRPHAHRHPRPPPARPVHVHDRVAGTGDAVPPLVPGIGQEVRGARLWVDIGPLRFQPASREGPHRDLRGLLPQHPQGAPCRSYQAPGAHRPAGASPGAAARGLVLSLVVLFVEKDLGSSLLFFRIIVVMLWLATGRAAYLVLGLLLFALGAFVGWTLFDHVQDRVEIWLNALAPCPPGVDPAEWCAHRASGSRWRSRCSRWPPGASPAPASARGHPQFIPDAHTDFVFSAIGEELGLLGTMAVLMLFILLIYRGFKAALRSPDGFGQLLAAGLSAILALQTFVIVGGVTRLIPLTGITLPFVSYGAPAWWRTSSCWRSSCVSAQQTPTGAAEAHAVRPLREDR